MTKQYQKRTLVIISYYQCRQTKAILLSVLLLLLLLLANTKVVVVVNSFLLLLPQQQALLLKTNGKTTSNNMMLLQKQIVMNNRLLQHRGVMSSSSTLLFYQNNKKISSSSAMFSTKNPSSTTSQTNNNNTNNIIIPRAAVSTCVQCLLQKQVYYYLLVQRGNEPNKGIWSFPGGKIEYGENTLCGAIRELYEEIQFDKDDNIGIHWYNGTVTTSDSIGNGYHYVIAQCYAKIIGINNNNNNNTVHNKLPKVTASDDADDVQWYTKEQIQDMENNKVVTPGVIKVIQRIEDLNNNVNLLPTTIITYNSQAITTQGNK